MSSIFSTQGGHYSPPHFINLLFLSPAPPLANFFFNLQQWCWHRKVIRLWRVYLLREFRWTGCFLPPHLPTRAASRGAILTEDSKFLPDTQAVGTLNLDLQPPNSESKFLLFTDYSVWLFRHSGQRHLPYAYLTCSSMMKRHSLIRWFLQKMWRRLGPS